MRASAEVASGSAATRVAPRRPRQKLRRTAGIMTLLLLITPALSDQAALTIPEPQYFSPPFSGKPTRIAVGPDGRVWVSIPSQSRVGAFHPTTGATEEYLVPEGMEPEKLLPLRDKVIFLLANRDVLGVLVPGSTQPFTVNLPSQPYDIAPSPSGFWISLPDRQSLLLLRADNFTTLTTIKVAVAYGEDVTCQTEEKLWAITSDYRTAAVVNLQNMETSFIPLPERAYGLAPSLDESVWLISSEANLMHLSESGEIRTYPLPQRTSPSSRLVPDRGGGVWYCDSARQRVGFRDQERLAERPLPGVRPTGPSASPDGYLWFIDDTGERLGRVRMSVSSSDGETPKTTTTIQVSTPSNQQPAEGPNTLLLVQIALAMMLLIAVLAGILTRKRSRRRKSKHR